jgi:hypothetical protein
VGSFLVIEIVGLLVIVVSVNKGIYNMFDSRGFQGYSSIGDFINTLINKDYAIIKFILVVVAMIPTFITDYIYDDARAIYTLLFLFLADLFTGSWAALKNKTFSSFKFGRILPAMTLAFLLLSVVYNLAKSSIYFTFLPSLFYAIISSQLLFSLIENAAKLGFIDNSTLQALKKKLDIKRLFK